MMTEPVESVGIVQRIRFTDGPSMAYSVRWRWVFAAANLLLYTFIHLFYFRIQSGFWFRPGYGDISGRLVDQLLGPVNIYQFPSQILVIGLLAGLICAVPMIIAQLYQLIYAVPFILVALFLGHQHILALCLFFSCAAVSLELFRFKSRFVALIVCLLPMLIYWWLFGGPDPARPEQDVLRWALLYAPWALAFFNAIILFGVTIAIGHVIRYRPGCLLPVCALMTAGAVLGFHSHVGMTECDFRAMVWRYSPQQNPAFDSTSIVPMIEQEVQERLAVEPYLNAKALRGRIEVEWRWAFCSGFNGSGSYYAGPMSLARRAAMEFVQARVDAVQQIDAFLARHGNSDQAAEAMYYKGLLFDMHVDQPALRDTQSLRYAWSVPQEASQSIWETLVSRFGRRDVSVAARWRLATLMALWQGTDENQPFRFTKAAELLTEARGVLEEILAQARDMGPQEVGGIWRHGVFSPPAPAMSAADLEDLSWRLACLAGLISPENRTGHFEHDKRLAELVGLNPFDLTYDDRLTKLIMDSPAGDPLIDNIQLARILRCRDADERIEKLTGLIAQYGQRDGAVRAMVELARIFIAQHNASEHLRDRQLLLSQAHGYLGQVLSLRPESVWADQAEALLRAWPIQ